MVKFYLDRKASDEAPVFLSLHHNGKRFKAFTGKKIEPNKWDNRTGRANPRKYKNNPIGFNQYLQTISDQIESQLNTRKSITKQEIKSIVDRVRGRDSSASLIAFADSFIQTQIEKGNLTIASSKAYRVTLSHLQSLKPDLTFEEVDLTFYDAFVKMLAQRGLATNSIGGHIKRLKWFMGASMERNLHSNIAFKHSSFETKKEETDSIFLTRQEIARLRGAKFDERLQRVADTFTINCYLGIRYSDLIQIKPEAFILEKKLNFLTIIQSKTEEKVIIPIDPAVVPLLKKHGFTCPIISSGKLLSVQKFNQYIKEACRLAGIDCAVQIKTKKGLRTVSKFELVSSHTARRSFSTNLYLEGVPTQSIMAVTGHRKEETFLLYIRANQLTRAQGLANHYESIR